MSDDLERNNRFAMNSTGWNFLIRNGRVRAPEKCSAGKEDGFAPNVSGKHGEIRKIAYSSTCSDCALVAICYTIGPVSADISPLTARAYGYTCWRLFDHASRAVHDE